MMPRVSHQKNIPVLLMKDKKVGTNAAFKDYQLEEGETYPYLNRNAVQGAVGSIPFVGRRAFGRLLQVFTAERFDVDQAIKSLASFYIGSPEIFSFEQKMATAAQEKK